MGTRCPLKGIKTAKDVRLENREETYRLRDEKRDQILFCKRLNPRSNELIECINDKNLTFNYVKEVTQKLVKSDKELSEQLEILRKIIGTRPDLVEGFFDVENSIRKLVSYLTGRDSNLHVEAAWCIANIAATNHKRTRTLMKASAPYLIVYLSSGDSLIQEHSAWGLGNMAGDGQLARDILKQQGILKPLVELFSSLDPPVVQAAAFALSNMVRDLNFSSYEIMNHGLGSELVRVLSTASMDLNVISEIAWLLSYLTYQEDICCTLVHYGIIPVLCQWFIKADISNLPLCTPLLRTIGNIVADKDEWMIEVVKSGQFWKTLHSYITAVKPHLQKESLWILSNLLTCDEIVAHLVEENRHMVNILFEKLSWTSPLAVKKQSMRCLCSLVLSSALPALHFPEDKLVKQVLELMMYSDQDLRYLCLLFLEVMIKCTIKGVSVVMSLDGVHCLEPLSYDSNEAISKLSTELIIILRNAIK